MEDIVKTIADGLASELTEACIFTERVVGNPPLPYYLVRLIQRDMKKELGGKYLLTDQIEVQVKPKNAFEAVLSEEMSAVLETIARSGLGLSPSSFLGKYVDGFASITFSVSYRAQLVKDPEKLVASSSIKIVANAQ